jgi:hypothetical protein
MAPMPAARFIPELGGEKVPPRPKREKELDANSPQFASFAAKAASKIEEAYQSGLSAGHEAALAEIEARLAEQRAQYEKQLALERLGWVSREAEPLGEKIGAGLKQIETRLTDIVARILRPFLRDAVHRQAIAELCESLESLIGANEGITLEISGPEDLLHVLRGKLSSRNVAALFTPSDSVDVRVVAGQTVLETCLGTWMKRIEERTL